MSRFERSDLPFFVFMGTLALFLVGTLSFVVYDAYQEYRAAPALISCAAQQQDARRYPLTDSVVCVPYSTRRDTLALDRPAAP